MTRAKRMQPVVRAVGHDERESAARLAIAERHVLDAERRHAELGAYQADYAGGLERRIAQGITANELRDFRTFLARLADAIRAQGRVLSQAKAECEAAREAWRGAARRARAIGHVVDRWQAEARRERDRRAHRETDARALARARSRTR